LGKRGLFMTNVRFILAQPLLARPFSVLSSEQIEALLGFAGVASQRPQPFDPSKLVGNNGVRINVSLANAFGRDG
jgi:hypothetical protein